MRRRTLALGVILLGGAALVLFCCAGRDERGANAPAPTNLPGAADTASGAPPATETTGAGSTTRNAAATGTAPGATPPSVVASTTGTVSAGAPPTGPGARIASAVQTSDPRDLELLANIERELKRDPPQQVHAIVAARKRGASRAELASMIAALPDLGLRALTFRWLDTVLPSADAGIDLR